MTLFSPFQVHTALNQRLWRRGPISFVFALMGSPGFVHSQHNGWLYLHVMTSGYVHPTYTHARHERFTRRLGWSWGGPKGRESAGTNNREYAWIEIRILGLAIILYSFSEALIIRRIFNCCGVVFAMGRPFLTPVFYFVFPRPLQVTWERVSVT